MGVGERNRLGGAAVKGGNMEEQRESQGFCASCGTAHTDTRFCRKCGAPLVVKAEAGPTEPPVSAAAPSVPVPPAPAAPVTSAQHFSTVGPPARDIAASAKKQAKTSNLLAIPGFVLFIAGLVFLGIAFTSQNSKSGNLGWGLVGILCLLVGSGLLIAALVFSILHWRDRARAHSRSAVVAAPQESAFNAQASTMTSTAPTDVDSSPHTD
jgi:hypothetical protein